MQLFTWAGLATVAGGALATALITNTLAVSLGWTARWVALVVALLISMLATLFTAGFSPESMGLAVVNGFVMYAAATGANAAMVGRHQQQAMRLVGERPFWSSWW